MRKVLALISDTHGGNRLGLLAPNTILYERDEHGAWRSYIPNLTEWQQTLWDHYAASIELVRDIAHGDPVVLIHCGDLTQGMKHLSHLMSVRPADQLIIARHALFPWYTTPGLNLQSVRIAVGTAAHNFSEGSSELEIMEFLQAKFPQHDTKVVYHGRPEIEGIELDLAHHGPGPGQRSWLEGNIARFYLRDIMIRDLVGGRKVPRLVFRGHQHTPIYEHLRMGIFESELYCLPSYCGMSDHAQQVTQSAASVTIGTLAIEVNEGKIGERWELYATHDLHEYETL